MIRITLALVCDGCGETYGAGESVNLRSVRLEHHIAAVIRDSRHRPSPRPNGGFACPLVTDFGLT